MSTLTLNQRLAGLGLEHFADACRMAGFETWEALSTFTEAELHSLNFRLGDRRKLQRAIARSQSWPDTSPLPRNGQLNSCPQIDFSSSSLSSMDSSELEETPNQATAARV